MSATPPSCLLCLARTRSLFRDADERILQEVSRIRVCQFFHRKEVLFWEGEKPRGVFCLHHGRVKLYKLLLDGKEQVVRIASGGDLLGYRALLTHQDYAVTAEALEEVHACFIPRELFMDLLKRESVLNIRLMEMMGMELNRAEQHMAFLAQRSVRERLAETLLYLRAKMQEELGEYSLPLNREDLASLVGTTRESVIRELKYLVEEGIIHIQGRRITGMDSERLAQIAGIQD